MFLKRLLQKTWTLFQGLANKTRGRATPCHPLSIVALAGILLFCNLLWFYVTNPRTRGENFLGTTICETEFGGFNSTNKSGWNYQASGVHGVRLPFPIPNDTVLLGEETLNNSDVPRFMTIGIPSVWRTENYLLKTLDSILSETSVEEKLQIYIYILLSDPNEDKRLERAKELGVKYKEHLDSGLIRILQPPASIYPSIDFSKIRRTYNDPVPRVQWRTKQALDFAFLFWYAWARQPSEYYLILEDDVISASHFVSAIKDFVQLHKSHHWISLQLTGFLGIGKLLRLQDLDRLSNFIVMFYQEHPVDILLNHWIAVMAPDNPPKELSIRRIPGLFQHVGIHSTLANKTQRIKDETFSLVKRKFSHVNPNADVVTTMDQYQSFAPESAYGSAPGMFWGSAKPKDTFDIIFPKPMKVERLFIATGTVTQNKKKATLKDKLTHGHVEVAGKFLKLQNTASAQCQTFEFLKAFSDGVMDLSDIQQLFPVGIQCIRIVVDPDQKTWVAISEIAVFTSNENNHQGG